MKVTDFVVNFPESCCIIVRTAVVAQSNKDLLWSGLHCIVYYWCISDGTVQ